MPTRSIPRRTLLKALGLAGAASLLPLLRTGSVARADQSAIPKRIVFFYVGQGMFHDQWTPIGVGSAPPKETAWGLSPLMSPLSPFHDQLIFLDSLDMLSANDPNQPGPDNAHIAGETHALTGANRATGYLSGGISIDQHIANGINAPMPVTAVPSLELGIGLGGVGSPCYAGPSLMLPMETDPNKVFTRLFPGGGTKTDNPQQRKSVLDFVQGEFAAVRPGLGMDDRVKLDAHASAVRDLEARLNILSAHQCTAPGQVLDGLDGPVLPDGERYEARAEAMLRLMTVAMTCDLTRVITLNLDFPPWSLFGYNPLTFGPNDTDEHGLVHLTNDANSPLSKNPDAIAVIARAYQCNVNYYARFLAMLAAVPEGDGKTLLDHTAVVLCGQLSKGDHSLNQLPWVIAGSCGGALKTGRYMQFPRENQTMTDPGKGLPHNNLFVSLANAMDVPTTTFGNPSVCTGPLDGLT